MHAELTRNETGITAGIAAGTLTNLSTTLEAEGAGFELAGAKLTSVRMTGYHYPQAQGPGYFRPTLWILPSSFDVADFDAILRTYNPWYDRRFLFTGTAHDLGAGIEQDRNRFTVATRGSRVMRDFGLALFLYEEASTTNITVAWDMTVRWEHA